MLKRNFTFKKQFIELTLINSLIFFFFLALIFFQNQTYTTRTNFILPYSQTNATAAYVPVWKQMDFLTQEIGFYASSKNSQKGAKWSFWKSIDEKSVYFDVEVGSKKLGRQLVEKMFQKSFIQFCHEIIESKGTDFPICKVPENYSGQEQESVLIGDQTYYMPRYQIVSEDLPRTQTPIVLQFIFYFFLINFLIYQLVCRSNLIQSEVT